MRLHTALSILLLSLAQATFAGDHDLTDAQIDAAMAKADTDGNGVVGLSEARRFGITKDTFRKANPDHNGALDRAEFATALRLQFAASRPENGRTLDWRKASRAGVRSLQIFKAADPDGDGKLNIAEYLSAMTAQAK